jgi:small subunit ribosomal protein S2e
MAERGGDRGGFGRGFGRGDRGDRGRGRGDRGRGRGRGRGRDDKDGDRWTPCTKLGRLVQQGKIKSLEHIYLFSIPIKEFQIVEHFIGTSLTDEVMKIMPVQKQTSAGQRMRFKAFVVVGDSNGHIGLGVKACKEVAHSIQGSMILAKLNMVPVRRGYWGGKIGPPHTIPTKITGKCGSVAVRLVPAPRGTGIVAAISAKKVLQLAGVKDVFTSTTGSTKTMGNFVKATYFALRKTYGFLSPELWRETAFSKPPAQEFTDFLSMKKEVSHKVNYDEY